MITMETLTEFLGWCTVINSGLIFITFLAMTLMPKGTLLKMQSSMFSISESDLSRAYFQYIAQFKLLVLVFNITPYIALKIMS